MSKCPLCANEMAPLFRARDYRRPHDRSERTVEWCGACAYGRVAGALTPDEVSVFYDVPYYTHGDAGEQQVSRSFLDRLRVHLAWRVDKGLALEPAELSAVVSSKSPALCDLGCGSGAKMDMFKAAGYRVLGVEPDPAARAVAQRAGEVLAGTAEALPGDLDGRRFDVVLLSHVLEHCIDPLLALANARNLLADDGTLVVETPNNAAAGFSMFKASWPWTDVPRHLHFFTERSLALALKAVGMSVSLTRYTGYTRQFDLDWIDTQNQMWAQLGNGSGVDFRRAAWQLLAKTAFAADALKYDSVRVHAVRGPSAEPA